jgi:hypothetical protein
MTKKQDPTLTDAKGMGGLHAQAGFEYQVWDAMTRLPAWLRYPGFEGLANEALEDIEARFFVPHAPSGHLLDRFQAKSGQPTKGEIQEVFKDFQRFDTSYPERSRVQTLVTPLLPKNLMWLARNTERIRRARPFYAPFADIQAANDDKLRTDLQKEFGDDLGGFVSKSVAVSLKSLPDQFTAGVAFATALHDAFPDLNIGHRATLDAHHALCDLCASNRGSLISRSQILALLREKLQADLIPDGILPLNILSDSNASRNDAIEIDARPFAGGDLAFPENEKWQDGLLSPLISTKTWARKHGVKRINLDGSFRLSTAFAIGWAFRSAAGFEIDIPTKIGLWSTDFHSPQAESSLSWKISQPRQLYGNRLLVGVGIVRDPSPGVLNTFEDSNRNHLLTIYLPSALAAPTNVQPSIRIIKRVIDEMCLALRPTSIDLFYVGPAAFAVALGHRWNGMPKTQFYEYVASEQKYTATVNLS